MELKGTISFKMHQKVFIFTNYQKLTKLRIKNYKNHNLTPFCPKTREPDFCRTCGFHRKFSNNMLFHFKYISNEI